MNIISKIKKITYRKIVARIHRRIVSLFGLLAYPSFWHYKLKGKCEDADLSEHYYAAQPNPGAGIGHQMANWIAGYWWAKQFELRFAHLPFSTDSWDDFLGFGEGEVTVMELRNKGYKIRRLPRFKETKPNEVHLQRAIISSYSSKKMVFIAEQDQGYHDQYGVMQDIQKKFYSAAARNNDSLIYDENNFNIAVHVRRGDIMTNTSNPNLIMRFLGNDYYYNVLKQALERFRKERESHIYLFSQGTPEDFPEFNVFKNIHWCFNMSAKQAFLHMVYADLLITSKSSFSYKPALLNKGIKLCPKDFWHGYPNQDDWFLCDNNGNIL